MTDHNRKRSCPIPEKILRPFGLDSRSWRLLILAPAVDLIFSDGRQSDSERRFLDNHPLRRNSRDSAEDFVPRLVGDPGFRSRAMVLLAESLSYPLEGDRENLIEDIEENLIEVAVGEQILDLRDGGESGLLSVDAIEAIDATLTKIGLPGRMARYKPKFQKYEYRDLSDQKQETVKPEVVEEAPRVVESVAHRILEDKENQGAWLDDCLKTLEAFLEKTRSEFESPSVLGDRLAECEMADAPYFHKGVGVLPEPGPDEKVYFIGDLHGDFETLDRAIEVAEYFQDDQVKLVFLGDYVDRGSGSLPVLMRIMEMKLENWDRVQMLRGNHEALRKVSSEDGGEDSWASGTGNQEFIEDVNTYWSESGDVWELFHDIFRCMTHFLIIGGKIAVCHGGVIPRFPDVDPVKGKISDELQADLAVENWLDLTKPKVEYFLRWARCDWKPQVAFIWNGDTMSSKCFDYGDVEAFLDVLGVETLVRGHDHPGEGYFVAEECERMVTICTSTAVNVVGYACTPKIAVVWGAGVPEKVEL